MSAEFSRLDDIDWHTWNPVDRATLLFVVRSDQILLINKKRGLGAGKVNGPGGRLDDGETPTQAAVREVREELHVTPMGLSLSGQLQFQFVDRYSLHVWVFRAKDFLGTPTETAEATPRWTPVDSIPYELMWEDDRVWLPRLLQGRRFFGRFLFDGDRMLDHHMFDEPPQARWRFFETVESGSDEL